MLQVSKLKKAFVQRVLFEDVSFYASQNDRIGLVGANGCGKTTLLKILSGEEQADEGSVRFEKDVVLGTMRQQVSTADESLYSYTLKAFSHLMEMEKELESIGARLSLEATDSLIRRQHQLQESYELQEGLTYQSRTRATLLGLGFLESQLQQSMTTLSGGQIAKAQLARLLLSKANFLLLDEPTNHLDSDSIEFLEDMLSSYKGAFIVVSHDRYFLDRVTNRTIEIKNQKMFATQGNYSRHVEHWSTQNEIAMRHYKRDLKEIKRIEAVIEQQKRWNQARNYVTAASKQKQLDRMKEKLISPERKEDTIKFRFNTQPTTANDILILKEVSKSFQKTPLFQNCDLLLKKGERVFLLGPNGCGKTTLLKIITRALYPDEGEVKLGPKVLPAYYEQSMRGLDEQNTAIEEVHNAYPFMNLGEVRNALAAFLLRGDDVEKKIGCLSGGERARIQLLKMMLSGANFLLLDEPTNHLDIASREMLEQALEEYEGSVLCVTHDRYLINRLADRVVVLTRDGLEEYLGGYDDYLEAKKQERQQAVSLEQEKKPNAYKEKKHRQNKVNLQKGKVERLEKMTEQAEAELLALNEQMASPEVANDYQKVLELSEQARALQEKIDRMYSDWEAEQQELEDLLAEFPDCE